METGTGRSQIASAARRRSADIARGTTAADLGYGHAIKPLAPATCLRTMGSFQHLGVLLRVVTPLSWRAARPEAVPTCQMIGPIVPRAPVRTDQALRREFYELPFLAAPVRRAMLQATARIDEGLYQ